MLGLTQLPFDAILEVGVLQSCGMFDAFGIVPEDCDFFWSFKLVRAWSGNFGTSCFSIWFLRIRNLFEGFLVIDLVMELFRVKKTGDWLRDDLPDGSVPGGVLFLAPILLDSKESTN